MRNLTVLSVVAAGLWIVSLTANSSRAAEDEESNGFVNGIADQLQKGDTAGAKKAAAELAKKVPDPETVMSAMKPRKSKGVGVGKVKGEITPDGIELKINAMARDGISAAALKKEGEALVRAGYVVQAIALYAHANPPEKDMGKKKKTDWLEWSDKMAKTSQELVTAAKGNDPTGVKKAASNIKNNCDACHAVFK